MSEFNITKFPTEILEKIFFHFDDTTNATAIAVCKRFNVVLSATIRRKYNGSDQNKWYEIEIFDSTLESQEIAQHRSYILTRVSAINLTFHVELTDQNHWIQRVINRIGRNIRMIRLRTPRYRSQLRVNFYNILSKTPNISHLYVEYVYPTNRKWCHQQYRKLTHLEMKLRTTFDENELKPFVKKNRQLKSVTLDVCDFRLLYAFDQTKIESLRCRFSHVSGEDIPVDIQPMLMAHLKKLELAVPKNSFNECVERIVAPCQNLQDLRLVYFEDFALTDKTVDLLCSLRSLETFEPCFYMPIGDYVRFIDKLPTLVTFALWHKVFTLSDYRMLLEAANRHPRLRYIHFQGNKSDIYNHSVLNWLMENANNRIQMEHFLCYKLVITKGKVQYDGVTIMSTNRSPFKYGKVNDKWFERLQMMTQIEDQYYEFFSNLPMLRHHFDETKNTHLHLADEADEGLVKRRGPNVREAFSTFSNSYDKSVNGMNWLERYCHRLQQLSIRFENVHPQLPTWTFPELNGLRIHSGRENYNLDLLVFESIKCRQLNCLKFVGQHPVSLTNIQVVRDIDLFDNLVTLEIFHFNEPMNNLLENFNQNVQRNLRHLTLANRRIHFARYIMNNQTIIAISKFSNLSKLKLILPGLHQTNTKFLFENCTKLLELYFECNFLSNDDCTSSSSLRIFDHIKSNCIALQRLQLVWHDCMMDYCKVNGIKSKFPNVLVKIMQVDDHMFTKAEQIVREKDDRLERLFDEFEV